MLIIRSTLFIVKSSSRYRDDIFIIKLEIEVLKAMFFHIRVMQYNTADLPASQRISCINATPIQVQHALK